MAHFAEILRCACAHTNRRFERVVGQRSPRLQLHGQCSLLLLLLLQLLLLLLLMQSTRTSDLRDNADYESQ